MSKPSALAVAYKLAPSMKRAVLADGDITMTSHSKYAGPGEHPLRLCPQGRWAPKLTEVTRQAAPTTGRRDRRCAGNARTDILPRRSDVRILGRHAQLYRGKWPTSKRMNRLYEGL